MKQLILILIIAFAANCKAQVTDTQIVNLLLGEKFYQIQPTLDSLGVWYHVHYPEKLKASQKVVSIANSEGTVKIFSFYVTDQQIREIVINYRHDDKKQLEDLKKITQATSIHVGKYSSDAEFKLE